MILLLTGHSEDVSATLSTQMERQCHLNQYNTMMVTCQVTHTGAEMRLCDTGISLTIPPGAIPESQSSKISLSISLDEDYPELEEGHTLICPIVRCQPGGLHFLKPAILNLRVMQ